MTLPAVRQQRHNSLERVGELAQGYALVHLVAQEMHKGLIETQVLDHMEHQATHCDPSGPQRVAVGFLEPVRVALRRAARQRIRTLQRRAPHVEVILLPYISRLSDGVNARVLSLRLRRFARGDAIVFHCRSESAVRWAVAFRRVLGSAAIVADFRGVWPDEYLHSKGVASPVDADPVTLSGYQRAMFDVEYALRNADMALAVSGALRDWLGQRGGPGERTAVVPTCVASVAFSAHARQAVRERMGVADKIVLAYAGTVTAYQHLTDGFIAFAQIALEQLGEERIHLLCITPDAESMRRLLEQAGLTARAASVLSVSQADVAAHLSAADAGFLLRDDNIVNRVSVPVKLGEYLAAGVPVVMSRVDGWLDAMVAEANAGWSIDWFGRGTTERHRLVAAILRDLRDPNGAAVRHDAALALCRRVFLWSAYTARVRDVYRTALARANSRSFARPRQMSAR